MNKFKRITAMFMVILTLFSSLSMMTVNAATEGTKTTIDASYRCYKGSDVGISGTAPIGNKNYYWHYNADGTALNCPIRFLKEAGTGLAVYCIEVGATFSGYTYDTKNLTDSPYWNSLSYTAQTGITYSTMYGYPVNNFGAANCDAYAATQTIIWEFAKGYRDLNGRTNAYYYNLMIKGSPAESAYNQLSAAIIAHNKRPSFAYSTTSTAAKNEIELKYDTSSKTWTANLTDANGVLSGYKVTSNGGLTVSKSGNTLTLSTASEINGTAQIQLARPLPSTGQALLTLYSTSSQNALIGQLQDPVTSYMTITTEELFGKVSAEKVDEAGTKLTGVVFGVYSDSACTNLITTMTTSNGVATSGDIDVNKYPTVYVKEKSMTDAQSAVYNLNSKVYTVKMVKNSTVSATNGTPLVNTWKDGKVKVVKTNENGVTLSGVVFGIYSDSACTKLIEQITTGSDGSAVSSAIDVGSSGSKTVYVREISMTAELSKVYSLNTNTYPVTVTAGKAVTANSGKTIVNNWLDGKVKVIKQDETGKPLAGVVFGVYSDKDCKNLITKITTGEDGSGVSANIDVGATGSKTVYVREISMTDAQQGVYVLNTTVYPVTISANKTVTANDGKAVINEWQTGKVKVIKTNENGEALADVVFGVYADKACTELITKITTNDEGSGTSSALDVGTTGSKTVYVKEISITAEQQKLYSMSSTVYPVNISAGKTVTVNSGKPVINNWLPGKFSVTKVNSAGAYLSGAQFTAYTDKECTDILKDTAGNAVVITTDKNGYAVSANIYVGKSGSRTVYVKETALNHPDSDIIALNTTVFPVVIKPNVTTPVNEGKAVINEYKPGKIMLVKENQNGNRLAGVTFSVYTDDACRNLLTTIVTDERGVGISEAISIDGSGKRLLFVKETALTDEQKPLYELSHTVYPVVVFPNQTVQVNNGKTIINRWTLGQITLTKVNENGTPLNEITFAIYEDEECLTPLLGADGKQVMMTTDENGVAISEGIEVNNNGSRKLYVKEHCISEVHGDSYVLDDTVYPVVITAGTVAKVNGGKEIVNKWSPARVSLYKVNPAGDGINGAQFTVYTDAECTTPLADENGETVIVFTDPDGFGISNSIKVSKDGTLTVFLKETAVEDTRVKLNPTVFEVKLSAGQNTEVNDGENIVNCFKTAPVKIKKSDMTTAEGVPGATIQIFDSNGTLVYEGVTLDDGNTEEIELRVGKYTFVETIAPAGYVLNKTVFEFSVNPDRTVTGDCEVQDKPTEWAITKSDVTTAEPLSGAEITIYDAEGKEVYKDVTKEDGTITAFYLPAGEYTFKETLAPEGYVINEEIFTFTVDSEGNVTGDNTVTDRKIKGNIKVIKTDEETGKVLAGAVFDLFSSDGKTKLAEGVTGADGYVVFGYLEYGDYIIKELDAPVGFLMKKTEFKVSIEKDGETIELTVKNSREPVTNVPKTGDESTSAPLVVCLVLMFVSASVLVGLWLNKSGYGAVLLQKANGWMSKIVR